MLAASRSIPGLIPATWAAWIALILLAVAYVVAPPFTDDMPACPHEDGGPVLPCYWDGGPNGLGDTYVVDVVEGELSFFYGDSYDR